MTTDGGLDRWGSDGPVVWHSETASLDYWHTDGIWSNATPPSGAADGGLDMWGSDGPVVWHSETAGLDCWHVDGIWSDYHAAGVPSATNTPAQVIFI